MNRLDIKITLTLETSLHTTGNRLEWGADKATAIAPDGTPIIRATTLKGLLRASAEAMLASWNVPTCTGPNPATMCRDDAALCPVCRVFGNPRLRSPLKFHEVRPIGHTRRTIRSSVSLSRLRRAALPQRLFFIQTVEAAPAKWVTSVEGFFPEEARRQAHEAAALVLLAARASRLIGGGRSRGLGWIGEWQIDIALNGERLPEEALHDIWQTWARSDA